MTHPIPDAVLAQHTAILGKTGSGKTSTEKLAVEQVVADGYRVCVLDSIKSDWWGITSSADGSRPGLPFTILGGPRGHLPLHSSAGKAIGQLVGEGKLPLSIIDMADFEPGGLQRFFIDFAPALMRAMSGVVYLVIEEAHEFAPKEKSGIGGENMATHWAKKLATAGRSKGIRLIVATQRIQSLHNAVLGSCDTVIAHRLTTPADQKPVIEWLKANVDRPTQEAVTSTLSSLPTGTGWICSGEAKIFERVAFPKFETYDNAATPTKDDGGQIDVAMAAVDRDQLRSIIGDAVKGAEDNDPARLRKEIADLKQQIGTTKVAQNIPENITAELAAAEKRGYELGFSAGTSSQKAEDQERIDELLRAVDAATGYLLPLLKRGDDITVVEARRPPPPLIIEHDAPKPTRATKPGKRADLSTDPLLNVAMQVWPVRMTWAGLASMCGRKARGGSFNTRRRQLLDSGAVQEVDGLVVVTSPPAVPVGMIPADLLEQNLPTTSAEAFKIIRRQPGISAAALASQLGCVPRGGSWNTRMSILRRNVLITETGGGLRLAPGLEGK